VRFSSFLPFLFSLVPLAPVSAAPGSITIDALVRIKHPSDPLWSPNGRFVSYVWDEGGIRNLYLVSASGGQPVRLTSFTDTGTPRAFWGSDSQTLYLEHAGGLWQADASGHQPARPSAAFTAKGIEFTLSPGGSQLAWVQPSGSGFDLIVSSFAHPSPHTVAHNEASIRSLSWS